jgi:hypothetical protein
MNRIPHGPQSGRRGEGELFAKNHPFVHFQSGRSVYLQVEECRESGSTGGGVRIEERERVRERQ